MTQPPRLSVVVPTLDAAATLPATLGALQPAPLPLEILVVDGGSNDGTAAIARSAGCRLLTAPRGRGAQLAAGAAAATAEWLLFLHADSRVQAGWVEAVSGHMQRPGATATAAFFRLRLDSDAPGARRVERLANRRARWLGLPYGDQGLLISRQLYESVGGFPPWPLMEDVALARRLGRRRLVPLPASLFTSAVRYERDGWWRRPLRNLSCLGFYFLGASPEWLARRY